MVLSREGEKRYSPVEKKSDALLWVKRRGTLPKCEKKSYTARSDKRVALPGRKEVFSLNEKDWFSERWFPRRELVRLKKRNKVGTKVVVGS